ncbi:exocyst complex component [Colletotrichum truncatum]|uniref:Exocyst complex component n=1 Tax=Colletotrichum truncatum TaxID=5467 RepID=A0ACC3ZCH0_COLTU|nr:exocyst complex component [Colletotrichum truncatum]KAF6797761.1 exocyst complex component [Colletotrichum truncatum]
MDSRAQRFEDEKRRIIESCFNKKDVDGSLLETYITHIRITEYSSHPTSPPPPEARTPQSEKPRVIVIAVRKSGRVRMHKTKENANGSFSIGKTWNLDDLSALESFTGPTANPTLREYAGDTGFIVTIGKPYFWNAQSDKEKRFFIASLVKIYAKYTGGKVPELLGFDQAETAQILRNDRRPPPPAQLPFRPPGMTPDGSTGQSNLGAASAAPSNYGSPSPGPPPGPRRPPPLNGTNSPVGSMSSSLSQQEPPTLRRYGNKSQESFAPSLGARSDDASSMPPRSRNGMPGPGSFNRFGDTPTEPIPIPPPQRPDSREPPPERKRPPMDPARPQGYSDRDLVPAPLVSPGMRRDQVAPPPRSTERIAGRKNSLSQRSDAGSYKDRPVTPLTPGDAGAADVPPALRTPTRNGATPTRPPAIVSPPPEIPVPPAPVSPIASTPPPAPAPVSEPGPVVEEPPVEPAEPPASGPTPPVPPPVPDEDSRPGLGPMIKSKKSKGDLAGVLWKAASAAAAFKPRPGGAGERLRLAANKSTEPSEGITSVFQPPPRPTSSDGPKEPLPESVPATDPAPAPAEPPKRNSGVPEVKVTVPNSSRPTSLQPSIKEVKKPEESTAKEEARKSLVVGNDAKYLASLGVDPTVLDNRSSEFTKWLDYFGWVPGEKMRSRNIEEMKTDLERELNKAQAGGWVARFQEEDDRVEAIKRGIDLAISECEEMENLLTLYSVELSTLSDDIAYIEAQGQGLQVQTANQKLLRTELESLLETTTITTADLNALRAAPLEDPAGLEDIEMSLVTLYKAMSKIDPSLLGGEPRKSDDLEGEGNQAVGLDNTDYGKMRIVQEKKEMYRQESAIFMRRLVEYMARQFDDAYNETNRALSEALSRKVDSRHHDAGRDMLWKYSPLIKYAKDVDPPNWDRMIQIYQDKSYPVYKNEFRQVLEAWKRNARKMSPDETAELLFTYEVEKQQEGRATTVRKLTVKRSQTLAKSLRSPIDSSSRSNLKEAAESRSLPYEVFGHVVDDLLPLVEMEQNFIVDFFHATTMEQSDFPDLVAASRPRDRRGGDLRRHRLMEPDRDLARRVTKAMEVIFSFLEREVGNLVTWVLQADPLQGAGVLAVLERSLFDIQQSNQDFLNTLLQKLHDTLEAQFKKFVDEQIKAIEDTKVKINKRKGVISFIRVFPHFSNAVENILSGIDPNLSVRKTVDREYDRILKSMFDSLKIIARENPAVSVGAAGADPEDKEALNFHILLIENMNHFLEEVNTHNLEVLEDWREAATNELNEHMGLYLNAVMRRPLGKLLEYIENIEGQLQSGKGGSSIAAQPSNSKSTFNKVLSTYDGREVRKGIETLRKRVDKHFGDADDPALSQKLVNKVLRECERFYGEVELRISRITADVYGGDVIFEWPRVEVKAGFR